MAIDNSNTLWVWGHNDLGQLGNGSNTNRNMPYALGTGFKQVAAGAYSSFAIREDGSLWAWGWNQYGQLGDGTNIGRSTPVRIGEGFTQVIPGYTHTLALKADGSLWAWGTNTKGELGNGTTSNANQLTPVLIGYFNFSKIAAGNYHNLAIKPDNTLWVWGDNQYGQLGTGNNKALLKPTQISSGCTDIMTGGLHSLCLKSNGQLWSWGWGGYGQLGNGNGNTITSPVNVGNGYQKLATGGFGVNTLFALKTNGVAWASGQNDLGQLGNGTTKSINRPQSLDSGYAEVAAGNGHTLALKNDGSVWAWGSNGAGQVGDGTTIQRNRPIKVIFADAPIKPVATTYIDFSNKSQALFAWEGRYVAILSRSNGLSPQVMAKWLGALDQAYQWYWWTTGFRPIVAKSYNGKLNIAEVPETCGAGCGYIGATGIEILNSYFLDVYQKLAQNNQYDQIVFYELGRNFWNTDRMQKKIATKNSDTATGYAVAMRFLSMDAGKLPGANFWNWTFPEFRRRIDEMVDLSAADKTQNWQNTLGVGQSQANNPSQLPVTNLVASFYLRLAKNYGGQAFLTRFWLEVAKRPDANNDQDAIDNYFLAACAASGKNLTSLFETQWRWPLSAMAKSGASVYPAQ